jgi:hypothetical protein
VYEGEFKEEHQTVESIWQIEKIAHTTMGNAINNSEVVRRK